ncbi:hypothetical protein BH23CHL2_BH23CHL2_14600 [soil metagenome]
MERNTTFEDVLKLVEQLSPVEKLRLIERVTPDIKREFSAKRARESVSLLGLFNDLGPAPSTDEIEASRNEILSEFPLDDI